MKLTVDEEADVLHLQLVDVPVEGAEEDAPGVTVDYVYLSKRPASCEPVGFSV